MTKFIQCEQCRVRIEDEVCKFATYVRVIDGKKARVLLRKMR